MKLLKNISLALAFILLGSAAVNAQSTRKEKQAKRVAEIKGLVDSQNYVFKANYVSPARGVGRALTSDYDFVVAKDSIIAYLPFFGRAYVAPPYGSNEGGIKFTNTQFSYVAKPGKKGGYSVVITPSKTNLSDWKDVRSMRLDISSDGYASLQVNNTNRDNISFNGTIESRNGK